MSKMMKKSEHANRRKKHWLLLAAVFFCFFTLYAVTAQRGVSWQDSGEFQYRILSGDYQWYSGIARAHPLYILMARGFVALFPKELCFYAMNLFSGLGLALALALLAYNVMRLTQSARSAVVAVSVLGFAHMAWWMGTVAEVYTWSLAFLMAEVLCVIRYAEKRNGWWFISLFGINGLHWSLHNVALLGFPVYAFLLLVSQRKRESRQMWVVCGSVVAWFLGGGLIIGQAAQLFHSTGNFVSVIKSLLFGYGYERQVLGIGGFEFKRWITNMALVSVSFVTPCWLFACRGLFMHAENGQSRVEGWLKVLTALNVLFWARYFVPDQATFVLPTLGLMALWVGVGTGKMIGSRQSAIGRGMHATRVTQRLGKHGVTETVERVARPRLGLFANRLTAFYLAVCFLGVMCASVGPWVLYEGVHRAGLYVARNRELPFRNELKYWLVPWKQSETSAAQFVSQVGKQLVAGDVLVADATSSGPLMAAREAGLLGKEWRLVTPWSEETDETVRALVRGGRMFVVSPVAGYAPKVVLESAIGFEREGVLYRVIGGGR